MTYISALIMSQAYAQDPPKATETSPVETVVGLGIAGFWLIGIVVLMIGLILLPRLFSESDGKAKPT